MSVAGFDHVVTAVAWEEQLIDEADTHGDPDQGWYVDPHLRSAGQHGHLNRQQPAAIATQKSSAKVHQQSKNTLTASRHVRPFGARNKINISSAIESKS